MLFRRSLQPKQFSTRITCGKCGTSLDLPGDHKNAASRECVRLGCDGQMTRYKPRGEAWAGPKTLTPDAKVTRPNGSSASGFVPEPVKYKSYQEYLASDLWQHIRGAVYRRDNGTCRICQSRGSVVHHLSYEKAVMEGRDLSLLALLCRPCHEKVEFAKDGKKRCVTAAARAFHRLVREHEQQRSRRNKKKRWKKKGHVRSSVSTQRRNTRQSPGQG